MSDPTPEQVEIPAEAIDRAMSGHPESWRETIEAALQAAAPSIRQQERERLEFNRLAEETGFEPGQQRKDGLPGEEATLVDHVLGQFALLGQELRETEDGVDLDSIRQQAAQQERERLQKFIESVEFEVGCMQDYGSEKPGPLGKLAREIAEPLEAALATLKEEDH